MFKPLTRFSKTPHRTNAGFAETQFLHTADDEDYSGFAPTQMADEDDLVDADVQADVAPTPADTRAAASSSHSALERAASAPVEAPAAMVTDEPYIPQSWVTSQWVAAQEAKAHEAANQARAVIAAQRRAEEQPEAAAAAGAAVPRTGLARLRAAFERLLPGEFRSLLPLFIGVTVTMTLISAVLPMFDKP